MKTIITAGTLLISLNLCAQLPAAKSKSITAPLNTNRQVLSTQYELDNFETTVNVRIRRGEDGLRPGQMVHAMLQLTDGRVIRATQNDIPISAEKIFEFSGGTIPINNDRFRNQSEYGNIGPFTFRGRSSRIQSLQLVIYEQGRMPSETPDNFDVAGIEMKAFVTDIKQTPKRIVESSRTILNETYSGLRVFGSGVLLTRELRPKGTYLPLQKDEVPPPLKFYLLTGGDAMKSGFSHAKFLVELKSGGILETDIRGATRSNYLLIGQTSTNIKWHDIKRIGIRYIYPSNMFDRDDWLLSGLAVDYDSFYVGPIRIFTDWKLNKTFNGDGQGTTWWSPVLNL
ncbi:MAG TPA: hypothetical protein DCQ34_06765 [Chitinophagaceae bacterium]|nr:hypothetical protein [Chitinophagaceae bacterium]